MVNEPTRRMRLPTLPRHRLLRDGPAWLAFGCVSMAIPPRIWTMLFMQPTEAYALHPLPAQIAVVVTYVVQLWAETWMGLHMRILAALGCVAVAGGSVGMFLGADWTAPQWVFWATQFVMEFFILVDLAVRLGKRE